MNRVGRAALMLLIGVVVMRLALTGGYGWFVQQRMQIPIILASGMLIIFGAIEMVSGFRAENADPEGAKRSISPAVGWLLVVPMLVLVAVAPTPLGAAAAQRSEPLTPTRQDPPASGISQLDDSDGPVELLVYDFLDRALWDETGSLTDKQVALEGIVVNDPSVPDGFLLTRFLVSCCAADGLPLQVAVRGVEDVYDDDTWVTAVVVWRPPPEGGYDTEGGAVVVEADVVEITVADDVPDYPYEDSW